MLSRQLFQRLSAAAVVAAMMPVMAATTWAQTEKVLYSFTGGSDGGQPQGALVMDALGSLYGATWEGSGTIFELTPGSGGTWTERVLHTFNGTNGSRPNGGLVFDKLGSLYGTTVLGGHQGFGTVFKLTPESTGKWKETVLYNFGKYASEPNGSLNL
jgi:uncharacterized repeat protein (TIGR03803 family)